MRNAYLQYEMRVAIPILEGRISPLLDVSRHFLLVDVEDGEELGRQEIDIEKAEPVERAKQISKVGVDVLICGAISHPLEELLVSAGAWVIPNTCGVVEEVLKAFLLGQLTEDTFLMPGCSGQRRRLRGRRGGKH
jgi:predicted Fe-Mo cluster-binding NifX family protein